MIISSVLIALSVVGILIVCVIFGLSVNIENMYAIVLDAGSTSTKQNLYTWKDYPFRKNGDVVQVDERRTEPGISDYVDKPAQAYPALKPHLEELITKIPSEKRSRSPVYLAATAGMRLKLLEDPIGSMDLFEYLRRGLATSGLDVETPNERMRMLSGSEEGLYGWVSVNNILKRITSTKQSAPQDTVGSLDLGGASMQIAFTPIQLPSSVEDQVDFFSLNLFGSHYHVYSHSYLCFGKNEFERRVHGAVITAQRPSTSSPVNHPCLLKGYLSDEYVAKDIFGSPCMSGPYAQRMFGSMILAPPGLGKFRFNGTGNVTECQKVVNEQFKTAACSMNPCTFGGVFQPNVSGSFRAYSGFSYFMDYLFPTKQSGFTKSEVQSKVDEFCQKNWTEITAQEPQNKLQNIWKYCFDGQFVLELLQRLYFEEEKWRSITFGARIDGKSVSWALGYMLDQSGYILSEHPKVQMSVVAFAVLVTIFLAILLASIICLALILGNCIR